MTGLTTGQKFRRVETLDLMNTDTPESTRTWCPISHGWLLETAVREIERQGFRVRGEPDLRLSRDQLEFFGMLNIGLSNEQWGLNVGLRNTHNKRASAAILLGTRVWVCDNLMYSADHTLIRKHHPNSYDFLNNGILRIMEELPGYVRQQGEFQTRLLNTVLHPSMADHMLVEAARRGAILTTDILKVSDEYRDPSDDNEESITHGGTGWGLFNAATYVGKKYFARNPETASDRSMALTRTFNEVAVR